MYHSESISRLEEKPRIVDGWSRRWQIEHRSGSVRLQKEDLFRQSSLRLKDLLSNRFKDAIDKQCLLPQSRTSMGCPPGCVSLISRSRLLYCSLAGRNLTMKYLRARSL